MTYRCAVGGHHHALALAELRRHCSDGKEYIRVQSVLRLKGNEAQHSLQNTEQST